MNLTIHHPTTGIDTIIACGNYTWIDDNTYTQSDSTAEFTIVGGATNGCDSTVTLNLTSKELGTSTAVITACGSYAWINNNTYTQGNHTAEFTIAGGAVNGCDSVISLDLTLININPSVIDKIDYLTPSYIAGDLYEWIDCNTEAVVFTGKDFYPAANGDYKVKITKDGCEETSDCFPFNALSVDENTIDNLVIYPNPTANILHIEGVKVEKIRVIGLTGQEILVHSGANSIEVSDLSPGSYFVEVNDELMKLFLKR